MNVIYPVIGKQTCLPFYITGIGVDNPEYHVIREPGLISHQFLFTVSGQGRLHYDGKEYENRRGDFFYVAPDVPHEYYPVDGDWNTCWVVFRGNHLMQLMKELGFDTFCRGRLTDFDLVFRMFQRMMTAVKEPIGGDEKASLLLYDFLLHMKRQRSAANSSAGDGSRILDKAVCYMEEHYPEDICLEELAAMSRVSKQHFCRVFKARMGMRPLEYLARKRIMQARALLESTSLSVTEIGKRVGYSDLTYFGMVFKKYEGISPANYRKNLGRSSV